MYSHNEDGAYCRFCIAFGLQSVGKGGHQETNMFVQIAFRNWKKALEKFKEHQSKEYHKVAVDNAQNFKLVYDNQKRDIVSEIDKGRKQQQQENRKKIIPIIRAVLLCGRQGLALRGHRDTGSLLLHMPEENDGNFRALLRFAIESGDRNLEDHLKSASVNATYLSARIQNEIIVAAGKLITMNIVKRVNESKCFSVLADETTDVSGIEQFSICVRYVDHNEGGYVVREDFLGFVPVEDVTGQGLANTLLTTLKDMGVNLDCMRGQGYDGARAMSGRFKGCAANVREVFPQAFYVHCANHNLNLAITHACEISSIRNCMGTIKEVVNFFRVSNKSGLVLKEHIKASQPEDKKRKKTRLLKFCETRWVEHLNSLSLFYDVYEHICSALEDLDEKRTKSEGVQPHALLTSIRTPQFIIALTVLKPIFSLTKTLSLFLQLEGCDLSRCVEFAQNLNEEVDKRRRNAETEFQKIFNEAEETAKKVGVNLVVPRITGRQRNRDNYEGAPEIYFRRSIFIPFLEHYILSS